jgi:hypothetical protein
MERRCPGCFGNRVAEGTIASFEGACRFELPIQQKGFWGTFGPKVDLKNPAFLCIDCGMLWTHVDKAGAIEEIARGGNDELLASLRIAGRPKRKWMWRLFGRR